MTKLIHGFYNIDIIKRLQPNWLQPLFPRCGTFLYSRFLDIQANVAA